MLNFRDPQRMTALTIPHRSQVTDAVIVTWDLPIPLLHSSPLSVSQWDNAVFLCPVILKSIQWENLQNFVMRYYGIFFDIMFRTVPFQCEKLISKHDILLVSNLYFYPSMYMQTQMGSNCTYHTWLFSLSCMSFVSFHANKCRFDLCLVATWSFILWMYTNILNPSSIQIWGNICKIHSWL